MFTTAHDTLQNFIQIQHYRLYSTCIDMFMIIGFTTITHLQGLSIDINRKLTRPFGSGHLWGDQFHVLLLHVQGSGL